MNINVAKLVKQCSDALPPEIRVNPWKVLNHGYDILDSEVKLNAYIASYGEMHIEKCRRALQQFPFEDLYQVNSNGGIMNVEEFEIYDWGCGQGIGTLTILQSLSERGILEGVKRINLIEPSQYALGRAEMWVRQSSAAHTEVRVYQREIPANGAASWEDIDCCSKTAIHIFSNILDLPKVGLQWLAKMTSKMSACSYFLCVGPYYRNRISRIADFHNYMGKPDCFSDFACYPVGYTSHTCHPYGIEVKGFKYERTSKINGNYKEQSLNQNAYDYDEACELCLDVYKESISKAYKCLRRSASGYYEIFLKPNICIERPDFILTSKLKGIVIVNVCENLANLEAAFNKVESIKAALIETYLKKLKIATIVNPSTYNNIKTGLFFPNSNEEEIESAIKELGDKLKDLRDKKGASKNKKGIGKWTSGQNPTAYLVRLCEGNCQKALLELNSKSFTIELYNEFRSLILPNWHTYGEGNTELRLTARQRELLNNTSKRLRIKGVAGSGKTHLLAYKSVKENLRTKSKVLILTYNIALVQYIRKRINEVPMDFCPNDIEIINFHQFFWSMARRYHGRQIPLCADEDEKFFEPYKEEIIRSQEQYQTIIVDEAQDYMTSWFECLRNYFLAKDGTFILFGDGEQNIFHRKLESDVRMPRVKGFENNPWRVMNERISMRSKNPQIAVLSSKFANAFKISSEPINCVQELNLFDYKIGYWPGQKQTDPCVMMQNILWIMHTYNVESKDVVVLSDRIEILRKIDYYYRTKNEGRTMCTFESEEDYEKVKSTSGAYLLDLKAIRRVAKVHFTTDFPDLKFATIASFKGWESKTVIIVLQNPNDGVSQGEEEENVRIVGSNDASLMYTALTRAKENLFILNYGNDTYHHFFKNNIHND